jgi:hypothetical protein
MANGAMFATTTETEEDVKWHAYPEEYWKRNPPIKRRWYN